MNGIDLERVWDAQANYLPGLESAVKRLSEYLERKSKRKD
ncbi:hypothetical protein M595_0405 [Lyngbya aestuarii BL J]|uniref:Uncharacterized protein n=1 Tax=Lyngbya aestuarii BL J TaxID=1348334 RepID=U7QTF4_9CYAN|nr:hypothetical protein M595_0405 [Lyngbya aestuarii BL J]